jgi:hypothetical protein
MIFLVKIKFRHVVDQITKISLYFQELLREWHFNFEECFLCSLLNQFEIS